MKTKTQVKTDRRTARHNRIRAKVTGTADRPRLAVFKSNTAMYVQLIDDATNTTLVASDTRKITGEKPLNRASTLGGEIAKLAKAKGVESVVFDRGGFLYQGAVAAVADGAREGGLKF